MLDLFSHSNPLPNGSMSLWVTAGFVLCVGLASVGLGRLACRLPGIKPDPFLSLVVGYALLSHLMILGDVLAPGAHWQLALCASVLSLAGWWGARRKVDVRMAGLALLVCAFAVVWNLDVATRMARFHATGQFSFWLDGLVHSGTLAQFGSPEARGRGMILMADMPRPLYHTATYMLPALLTAVLNMPPLDATMLVWLPMGILVMACGIAALGLSLGGPAVAAAALMALALVPAPEQLTLGNGYLSFAWLLETAPATSYSIGVACAALAALVRWMQRGAESRRGELALALVLTALCFLVRANTFVLLAPVVALSFVAGLTVLSLRWRITLISVGLLGFIAVMAMLSWPALAADPRQFLFAYSDQVHINNSPKWVIALLVAMQPWTGMMGTSVASVLLTLLALIGPWLPAFVALAILARRQATPADALPWLLLVAGALEMFLAPVARNGDMTEFRHRAGPLIVLVIVVWTMRWAVTMASSWAVRLPATASRIAWPASAVLSLCVLAGAVGAAKRPAFPGGDFFYSPQMDESLIALAPALVRSAGPGARFAVAHQPPDSRNLDNAARLVGLTGVPAYLSCPGYLIVLGGPNSDEARRRLAVIAQLDASPDLASLWRVMRAEKVTHYVTSAPAGLSFDPAQAYAAARSGSYALYALPPGS